MVGVRLGCPDMATAEMGKDFPPPDPRVNFLLRLLIQTFKT